MNIQKMMQQAQAMKQKMAEMQEKVLVMEIPGQSGGGMVQVVLSGKGEVKKLKIDPQIVNPAEIEMLEDLVTAAVNDARNKVEEKVAAETQRIMSELGLPAGAAGGLPL